VSDDGVEQAGLPGAGFAADEDVALDERDGDQVTDLVHADEDRVEDGQ
jgi:hypothetical protein